MLPVIVVALFATFSGVYHISLLTISQLLDVCHGVSTKAIIRSPLVTVVHHNVHGVDTIQKSHFATTHTNQEPHVDGYRLLEAS